MRPLLPISPLVSLLLAVAPVHAQDAIDLPALIECRQQVADFSALASVTDDPLKAVALGWRPLPQDNMFMSEYALNTPVTVFGHATDLIAVAGPSIMAILDLPDPHPLADALKLETGYDADGKFMAGRELVSRDVADPHTGEAMIESVILSVSTVKSHPGKTLAGCTYSLDLPDEGAPEAASGEAKATPPA